MCISLFLAATQSRPEYPHGTWRVNTAHIGSQAGDINKSGGIDPSVHIFTVRTVANWAASLKIQTFV